MNKLRFSICALLLSQSVGADIAVEDAYVPAMPPQSMVLSGYFTISNSGSKIRKLVEVKSPAFGMVYLHETKKSNGVSSMESLDYLQLEPGETVKLEPGGKHLMMMKPLEDALMSGRVLITLVFENGENIEISILVNSVN